MFARILLYAGLLLSGQACAQFSFSDVLEHLRVNPQSRSTLWANSTTSNHAVSVLYRSKDLGKTWQGIRYNTDPAKSPRILDIQVHPTLGERVFVLTTGEGGYLWTTTDGGQTWQNPGAGWPAGLTSGGVFVAAPPSQLVYVLIGQQLRRSTDGGATFDAGIATPCTGSFEGSPADPRRLACYNTSQDFFQYSIDEGRNWTNGARAHAQLNAASCRLVNDFHNPLAYYIYCFAGESTGQRDLFFRSTDGLQSVFIAPPTPHGFPNYFVSPDRSLILSFGTSNTMSRSRDLGQTWETFGPIGSGFGFDPVDANIVYLDGKSRSTDGGRTYTDTVNRTYVPVLSSIPPVEITLESGTSYDPQLELRDPANHAFFLTSFTPVIPATTPWIRYEDFTYIVSSAGLSTGTYQADIGLTLGTFSVGQLTVRLQVVPRRDPPAFLRSTPIAGNGVFRSDFPPVAEAWPGVNGPATSAALSIVYAMTSDAEGNLYAAFSNRVLRIAADGALGNFAGTGAAGATGDGGQAAQATFQFIRDVLKINEGVLILEDVFGRLRLVRPTGIVEPYYTPPTGDPVGLKLGGKLAVDSAGTVFVATYKGVHRRESGGTWTKLFSHADVLPDAASVLSVVDNASSFAIDRRDNSFVLGYVDRIVRRTLSGQNTLLVGTPGKSGFAGDGGSTATGSLIDNPGSLAVNSHGAIYFADHNRVRVILPSGVIGTAAGNGEFDHPPADNAAAIGGGLDKVFAVHARANDELAVFTFLPYIFRMETVTVPLSTGTVVEFYHPALDNYFITADLNEQAAVDAGAAGADWRRTGGTFKAGGPNQVCRFYGSQSPGPNSHFYTAEAAECAELKRIQTITPATQKRWNFESNDFNITPAFDGACPAGLIPIYRAYNSGFARGIDSNHRITASQAAIQEVVSRGWNSEGVVMCATP